MTQELSAQQMSATYGITVDAARQRMLQQPTLMNVADDVAAFDPDSWGGSSIDWESSMLTLYSTRPARTSEAVDKVAAQRGIGLDAVKVQRVAHSVEELDGAARKVRKVFSDHKVIVASMITEYDKNRVVVTLPASVEGSERSRQDDVAVAAVRDEPGLWLGERKGGIPKPVACNPAINICDPPLTT